MNFISKIGDIVIMENGERYIVIDCVEYNDAAYLKIGSVIDENKKEKYVEGYVKESISTEDRSYKLTIVSNKKLVKELDNIISAFYKPAETVDGEE